MQEGDNEDVGEERLTDVTCTDIFTKKDDFSNELRELEGLFGCHAHSRSSEALLRYWLQITEITSLQKRLGPCGEQAASKHACRTLISYYDRTLL